MLLGLGLHSRVSVEFGSQLGSSPVSALRLGLLLLLLDDKLDLRLGLLIHERLVLDEHVLQGVGDGRLVGCRPRVWVFAFQQVVQSPVDEVNLEILRTLLRFQVYGRLCRRRLNNDLSVWRHLKRRG